MYKRRMLSSRDIDELEIIDDEIRSLRHLKEALMLGEPVDRTLASLPALLNYLVHIEGVPIDRATRLEVQFFTEWLLALKYLAYTLWLQEHDVSLSSKEY